MSVAGNRRIIFFNYTIFFIFFNFFRYERERRDATPRDSEESIKTTRRARRLKQNYKQINEQYFKSTNRRLNGERRYDGSFEFFAGTTIRLAQE